MVNAKQRDKKATTLSVFVLMIKVGGARMCLRFMAFLIISQICEGGPHRKDCFSQLHIINRKISLKLEISKTDFAQFLQQA